MNRVWSCRGRNFDRFKRGDLLTHRSWINIRNRKSCTFRFRIDPVPFTGGYKSYGRCLRHPGTTQEKSKTTLFLQEMRNGDIGYNIKVNQKRNYRNIANAYDDIYLSVLHRKRDWKRSKIKKQWMKNTK